MTITLTGWPVAVLAIIATAVALLALAYGVLWLSILVMKYRDPERYANFRMLRDARKGKR